MKATIVLSRYDVNKCEDVLEQWTAEEILPAVHQVKTGNGKYVLVRKPEYSNLYDVRSIPHYNLITWLIKTAEDYYGHNLHSTIITNLE